MMKLYVGNLSFRTSENELRQKFEQYGTVNQVNVINDRETGRSKGFAFVEMQHNNEADDAIHGMNGFELGNRQLTVNEARPRESRPGGNRSYGNSRY